MNEDHEYMLGLIVKHILIEVNNDYAKADEIVRKSSLHWETKSDILLRLNRERLNSQYGKYRSPS